jgi:hypothetical protein
VISSTPATFRPSGPISPSCLLPLSDSPVSPRRLDLDSTALADPSSHEKEVIDARAILHLSQASSRGSGVPSPTASSGSDSANRWLWAVSPRLRLRRLTDRGWRVDWPARSLPSCAFCARPRWISLVRNRHTMGGKIATMPANRTRVYLISSAVTRKAEAAYMTL